jgi:hypothetical protein
MATSKRSIRIEDCHRVNIHHLVQDGGQQACRIGSNTLHLVTFAENGRFFLTIDEIPNRRWELVTIHSRIKRAGADDEIWFLACPVCHKRHREFLFPRTTTRELDMTQPPGTRCEIKARNTSETLSRAQRPGWRMTQRARRGHDGSWVDGRGVAMKRRWGKN